MKYERLALSDLKDLEKEFIEFLVINGITADEWERLKKEDIKKVEGVIDQFSDVVWEGVLRKTEMVERRRRNAVTVCRVKENVISTIFVEVKEHEDFNLLEDSELDELLSNPETYHITIKKDPFEKTDSEQLFELIKSGFYITKEERYVQLFSKYNR